MSQYRRRALRRLAIPVFSNFAKEEDESSFLRGWCPKANQMDGREFGNDDAMIQASELWTNRRYRRTGDNTFLEVDCILMGHGYC